MFLVNRTLRSFRTSALHPFRTRALRPPPIAHPLAYYASKRVIHSEFSKAGLGTGNTIHPKVSHVTPCSGEDVCEEDKADLRHQAKGSGDIHKVGLPLSSTTMVTYEVRLIGNQRVAILQAVQQQAIVGAIPRLEGGVKEFKLELGEGAGGSKVKLNEYMGWLGSNFWMMITVLVGFGGMVCYTEIISPGSLY